MTKKLSYILIFVLVAVVAAGIAVSAVLLTRQNDFDKDITLSSEGTTQESMEFSLEGLYPGKNAEYTVRFGKKTAAAYDVTLTFRANGNTELAPYIDAELVLNGETVVQEKLSELLEGGNVNLSLANGGEDAVLVIRYTMPTEVGNEAQELTADFAIDLEASPV